MTTTVFLAVLLAAALHASWNAIAKGGIDKELSMAAVVIGHVPLAVAVLPFVPTPSAESVPYIIGGTLIHFGYQLFLLNAYKIGDLSQVYPIARGSAPLIVAAVSMAFLGVVLSRMELIAIAIIAAGIISLGLVRKSDGLRNGRATLLALGTGVCIASYSLVDGLGARVAGTAFGYYGWLTVLNAILFAVLIAMRRPGALVRLPFTATWTFFVGGTASFLAYVLVVFAFTQAPIALVTALRETSIVFALLIGVVVFHEKLSLAKVLSTFTTLFGAALLRFAKS